MKVIVTGAQGFIGRALVTRLLSPDRTAIAGARDLQVVRVDHAFADRIEDPCVRSVTGDLASEHVMEAMLEGGADVVFHLASVAGGAAEKDFELGQRVNLLATIALLDRLRTLGGTVPPRLVFASTIGVYGVPMPDVIDESTEPAPSLSYGVQKLIGEILIADATRRGFIEGASLRLPGIVARPPQASGMLSIFLSDLIRNLSAGREFACPVSAQGVSWWMSRECVVDNLLHAARLSPDLVRSRRVWLLPVLRASMADVVDAIARIHGERVRARVTYRSNATLEAQFAHYPPLHCPSSDAAGFRHDGSLERLVTRALIGD